MPKKKTIWYQKLRNWLWIAGIPTACGAILMASRVVVTYADVPKTVSKLGESQSKIADILEQQQESIEYLLEQDKKAGAKKIEIREDGKKFWNDKLKEWRPIEELTKYLSDDV